MTENMITIFIANAGLPMITLALPPMAVLLIPVILIEVWSGRRLIETTGSRQVWFGIAGANLFSTFIGWPLAWAVLVGLQLLAGGGGGFGLESPAGAFLSVTVQAPWLLPTRSEMYWMIPAALAVLLVPFFFVSVYVERFILGKIWRSESRAAVIRFSWTSHLYSYAFLYLVVVAYGCFLTLNRT